jgi:hypothetical protein
MISILNQYKIYYIQYKFNMLKESYQATLLWNNSIHILLYLLYVRHSNNYSFIYSMNTQRNNMIQQVTNLVLNNTE